MGTSVVTFELSERDKEEFRSTVAAVTADEEQMVREQFPDKLVQFDEWVNGAARVPDFIGSLVEAVRLLYAMLLDETYELKGDRRSWVVAALMYFISPFDAIPDSVPVFGYMDDAILVAWVCQVLGDELDTFRAHQAARASDA